MAPGHELIAACRAIAPGLWVSVGMGGVIKRMLAPGRRQPQTDLKRLDALRRSMGRMAECHDGLCASDPTARRLFDRGISAMRACNWHDAISHLQQAKTETNGVHLVALLNLSGVCNYTSGRADAALRDFEESERLAATLHAGRGRARALNNIGLIRRDRGELDPALATLSESLALTRGLADQWVVAILLGNIGNVWHDKGDLATALSYHEQALTATHEIGDRWGEACELGNIGSVYLDKGEPNRALRYYLQGLAMARAIGYQLGVATGLANVASICRSEGRLGKALQLEKEALAVARKAGDRIGMAAYLGNIGLDLMSRRKHSEAVPRLAAALTILSSVQVADGPRQALTGLVVCEDRLGRGRIEGLLREFGLREGKVEDVLDRMDQIRMKRPAPLLSLQAAGP